MYGLNGLYDELTRKSVSRFERFVNGVLENRERTSSLDTVRYAHFVDDGEPPSMEWLDSAALLMLRAIHICINIAHSVDVPDLVFSCTSLKHLKMFLYTGVKRTILAPASINLPSLKRLELRSVQLYNDFAQQLFEGCPSLERLELVSCDLYVSDISSDVLKELTILMCRQYEHKQISCPSVVTLLIDILHHLRGIQLKNMPSLVNADLQLCKRGCYFGDDTPVLNLFGGLSNTASLKISLSYPESKVLKKQLEKDILHRRDFINLKNLSIGTWNMSCDFCLVACLLKRSPNLKELITLKIFTGKKVILKKCPRKCFKEVFHSGVSTSRQLKSMIKGARKLSRRLIKTLVKTLHSHIKKIGNIVIFPR